MLLTKPARASVPTAPASSQAKALAVVLREEFGVPFALHDAGSGDLVGDPEAHDREGPPCVLERAEVLRLAAGEPVQLALQADGLFQMVLVFPEQGQPELVAVGYLTALGRTEAEIAHERFRLLKWLQTFRDRLRLAGQLVSRHRADGREETQTAAAWETILTLDHLLRRVRIHREPGRDQKRLLQAAHGLLQAKMLAWVPAQTGETVQLQGEPVLSAWDCRQLAGVLAQEPEMQKSGLVLCNQPQASGWAARYPQIENLLALQLSPQGQSGWFLALNKLTASAGSAAERARFRRSDAALLMPFAALLDLHLRASGRYGDLKELLVGLTRSLTAAIDAKDSYTYGHSERVARIAVELGRELGLEQDERSDIYLAGLLHDIGKIGIRDSVLCKREPLTPEEFEHIKQHVTIGYRILADLRPIRNLLPGVLHHHEHYDGRGYPDGLKGEAIPLLARILAVADSYDAMSTARPYRSAMPTARVEEILAQGAGTQWDRRVVEAFLRCKDKVRLIRQRGVGESLGLALDGALRNEESARSGLADTGSSQTSASTAEIKLPGPKA